MKERYNSYLDRQNEMSELDSTEGSNIIKFNIDKNKMH